MATYRDDLNDTVVAGDGMRVHLGDVVEDTARASETVFMALSMLVTDSAVAADGAPADQLTIVAHDTAVAGDETAQALAALNRLGDRAMVGEVVALRLRTLAEDTASASDGAAGVLGVLAVEAARATDEAQGHNRARSQVGDTVRARDFAQVIWRDLLVDQARATDEALGRARVVTLAEDWAVAGDGADANADAVFLVLDAARAWEEAQVFNLRARTLVVDAATADDLAIQWGDFGQAWTSNTDTWAMSRYAPFTFTALAVVDGVLVGCAEDGVYALDGLNEQIAAVVATGKLDMTGRTLSIPVESHLEYALAGIATVDVTTTQDGAPETYSYPLDARPLAEDLTNARAEFGRGLLGRHFAYTLRLTGTHAHINDWSVLIAPSNRSI